MTGSAGIGSSATWIASESPEEAGNLFMDYPGGVATLLINPVDANGINQVPMLTSLIGLIQTSNKAVLTITDGTLVSSFYVDSGTSGSPYYTFTGTVISGDTLTGPSPYVVSYNIIGPTGLTGSTGYTGSTGLTGPTGMITPYIFDGGDPFTTYYLGPAFDCGGV